MTNKTGSGEGPPALEVSGTVYGEDLVIDFLRRTGRTEATSGLLRSLVERHPVLNPRTRTTSSGAVLRLVVNHKPDKDDIIA